VVGLYVVLGAVMGKVAVERGNVLTARRVAEPPGKGCPQCARQTGKS
jgi:hypothetical protein